MTFIEELTELVDEIARKQWELREGRVVPESENVGLGNVGVRLEATILCADLADSTRLAMTNRTIASEVYKAFLVCSSKIMRLRAGEVRSFNGDRVMGVFIGSSRNTNAAKAALNINTPF